MAGMLSARDRCGLKTTFWSRSRSQSHVGWSRGL